MTATFDLTAKRLVWIKVHFAGVVSDGDAVAEPVEHSIDVRIELVNLDEFGRLFVSPLDDEGNPNPDAVPAPTPERLEEWDKMNDTDRALAIINDWRGVVSNGTPVPFSEEALRVMMRVPNFAVGLFRTAYPRAYAGLKDTRSGNSASSPANGAASADAE
jgi:hypothetical protein